MDDDDVAGALECFKIMFSQYAESTCCLHLFKFRKRTAAGCLLCMRVCECMGVCV